MKPKQSPANKLTDDILKYLFSVGVFCWREDSNPVPVATKGLITGFRPPRQKGKPDIMGSMSPFGRTLGVEVKIGKDRLRPEQIGFHANLRKMGGLVLVVKTFEDFINQWEEYAIQANTRTAQEVEIKH